MSRISETLDADLKAMEIYLKLGYTKEEHETAFNKAFGRTAVIDREKGEVKIYKSALILNEINAKRKMIVYEINHFDYHVKDRKLRRKLSGEKIQGFIDFLIENKLFHYANDYKKKFWFKLLINKIKNKVVNI